MRCLRFQTSFSQHLQLNELQILVCDQAMKRKWSCKLCRDIRTSISLTFVHFPWRGIAFELGFFMVVGESCASISDQQGGRTNRIPPHPGICHPDDWNVLPG